MLNVMQAPAPPGAVEALAAAGVVLAFVLKTAYDRFWTDGRPEGLGDLAESLESIDEEISSVAERIEEVDEAQDGVRNEIVGLKEQLDELAEDQHRLKSVIVRLAEDQDAVDAEGREELQEYLRVDSFPTGIFDRDNQ